MDKTGQKNEQASKMPGSDSTDTADEDVYKRQGQHRSQNDHRDRNDLLR